MRHNRFSKLADVKTIILWRNEKFEGNYPELTNRELSGRLIFFPTTLIFDAYNDSTQTTAYFFSTIVRKRNSIFNQVIFWYQQINFYTHWCYFCHCFFSSLTHTRPFLASIFWCMRALFENIWQRTQKNHILFLFHRVPTLFFFAYYFHKQINNPSIDTQFQWYTI